MKKVYPEVWKMHDGTWQGGVMIEENGLGACPGLDCYVDTRKEAIEEAEATALDYYGECIEQSAEVELCELRVNEW